MITGLLTTDPARRYTLNTIRTHPWFRQGSEEVPRPIGIKVSTNCIPVDPGVLKLMGDYNEVEEEARKYV